MWRPIHNINHCIDGLRLDKLAPFTFRVVLWICLNKNIQLNQLHLPITRHQSAATCKKNYRRKMFIEAALKAGSKSILLTG